MIASLRRGFRVYGAIAAMQPKLYLAYRIWVWMDFVVQIVAMTIFLYFWRAVYANSATLGGLSLDQTLNYILIAQILAPLSGTGLIGDLGYGMREGLIGIELLRPLDFQGRYYAQNLANLTTGFLTKVPLAVIAIFLFGIRFPTDGRVWIAFLIAFLLGNLVIFFFDWILACAAFFTTEVWGLSVLRYGIGLFFSGSLVPLDMMPPWLRTLTNSLPFAQSLYMPVSLLSGIAPLSRAPLIWLVQIAWIAGLFVVSRLVFRYAVRAVTVQGG